MPDTLTTETEIKQEALTVIERSKIVKIVDQKTYDAASELLLSKIKPFRVRWKNFWYGSDDGPVPLAYRAYKSVLGKFNEVDDPLEEAERRVKVAVLGWEREQARLLREAQEKAQRQAEQREEEERLQAATLAEESGATAEEVQAIAETKAQIIAAPVEPTFQRATGMSKPRDNWKCRVTDLKALARAVGAGKVPVEYILPNEAALNARAKADRQTLNIPGCMSVNEPIIAGRSK